MKESVLKLENICKKFDNNIIHDNVSFELYKGETIGLLGYSGCGKSVLLRSIIGLDFIDDGKIFFRDKRIDNLPEDDYIDVRKKISYAFQKGALFDSLNVFENIAFPLFEHTNLSYNEIKAKVKKILNIMGLPEIERYMPTSLSGGMQKRVGIARSIILDPEIVLYDEPTSGLDPQNKKKIISVVEELKKMAITSIFVTHDIPTALKVCDRLMILSDKKIRFMGTPELFLSKSEDPIIKNFIEHMQEEAS